MREIVLDTETTGLDPAAGHRVVEIGCVELNNHLPTGVVFHEYLDPERDMPADAAAVHGLTDDFLRGQPLFAAIVERFLEFLGDAPLIIHNAEFDLKFLNAELARCGFEPFAAGRAIDTLKTARRKFPGAPASLDALCKRFNVDNSDREKHGALLDAELLAEVYLELEGGRQVGLGLGDEPGATSGADNRANPARPRPKPLPPRLRADEAAAHAAFVDELGPGALWRRWPALMQGD